MAGSSLVMTQVAGVTFVNFVAGSITDPPAVEKIGEELYALVDRQSLRKIVLDFRGVQFLSSMMLGVLITLNKKSRAIGGRTILCGLRPELHKVFKIMKLEKIIEFAPDETEAAKMLGTTS